MRVESLLRVLPAGRDRLSPLHLLAVSDSDHLKVRVERANLPPFVVFVKDVLDDHDIAPQPAAVLGEDNMPVRDGEHILTEIGVAAPAPVPVFTGVNPHAV